MKNLLILAHPDRNSFQASFYHEMGDLILSRGESLMTADLYGDSFPPVLPPEEISRGGTADAQVLKHQNFLREADRIMIFYPDWWGMPPAILKGWVDRVLASETAYRWEGEDFLEKSWEPLLAGKEVLLFVSADGPLDEEWLRTLWDKQIFGLCGASLSLRILDRIRERSYGEIRSWVEDQKASI